MKTLLIYLFVFIAPVASQEVTKIAAPLFEVIELYGPGHFGNSYEVSGRKEMYDLLSELKYWGFNRSSDWFDMDDCRDPFGKHNYGLSNAQWQTKKTNYGSMQQIGLSSGFLITPNHVYIDQCLPERAAVYGTRIQGQLVCPSKPEVKAMILKNYENLFHDLKNSSVQLDNLIFCPYDNGGCACDQCHPWIVTFADLSYDIFMTAKKTFPDIRLHYVGWWWVAEEHTLFAEWFDTHAPNEIETMFLYLQYGTVKTPDVILPKGAKRGAFVHIGYSDVVSPRDIYGHTGPVIAAKRLAKTVEELKQQGVTALMCYSEGIYEDVNKALIGGLASGQYDSAQEVLTAYAERYFGTNKEVSEKWAQWLEQWGSAYTVDTDILAKELTDLLAETPAQSNNWRLEQWKWKLELFAVHKKIMDAGTVWTPERLEWADRFWDIQEKIHRSVWGIAPPRHIFARYSSPMPWYASWAQFQKQQHIKMLEQQ